MTKARDEWLENAVKARDEWLENAVNGYEWLEKRRHLEPYMVLHFAGDLTTTQTIYAAIMSAGCRVLIDGTLTVTPDPVIL